MTSRRGRRLVRLAGRRGIRAARRHYFSIMSAALLLVIGAIALSSDSFQSSRQAPDEASGFRATWAPPTAVDPEVASTYVTALMGMSPLERARLRPPSSRSGVARPFPVTLPDASDQEMAEFLLTALADADSLGLQLLLTED